MVKLPMTFTADEEIQESMKASNIENKKKSKWINDKIKKGLLYDNVVDSEKPKQQKPPSEFKNVVLEI